MTETVLSPLFATYADFPSGVTSIPQGPAPTVMVPTTVLLVVSITDTVPSPLLVT